MAINLSDEVLAYRPLVSEIAARYGMSDYVELILAVMMQESGGTGKRSHAGIGKRIQYPVPQSPGTITDPEYSIGVRHPGAAGRPAESRMHRADGPGPDQAWPSRAIITVPLTSTGRWNGWRLYKGKRHCLLGHDVRPARLELFHLRGQGVRGSCPALLPGTEYRRHLPGERDADPPLHPDGIRKHPLRHRLHCGLRLRAYRLCHR